MSPSFGVRLGAGATILVAALATAQEVRLTRPLARLPHQFSAISGLRELRDGRVLVSDGIDQVVVRVDLARQRMDTVGRAGQGPGEYRSPDLLLPLPDDGTLLVDLGNARLTVLDGTGRYRESIPIAQGTPGAGPVRLIIPRGTDASGRVYFQPAGALSQADSGGVVRWDRAAGRFDTVARVKLPAMVTRTSGGANERRVAQRPAPYPVQDTWAVAPDGRLALIRAPVYRVDWVAPGGARTVGKPIPAASVPIRDAEKREWLADQAANGLAVSVENVNGRMSMSLSRGRGRNAEDDEDQLDLNGPEWPAAKPVATGVVLAGPDGRLWIERSAPAGAARPYDVIGPAGEVVGRVVLPVGRRLVAVGARGLYARHVDDDGISYLELYGER